MFRVELEGFNDGLPYFKDSFDSKKEAKVYIEECRRMHPRVRFRMIRVVEDWK